MRLNGIELKAWDRPATGTATFDLSCSMADALAIDASRLSVTDDGGNALTTFSGYSADVVERIDSQTTRLWCRRGLDDSTGTAIEGIENSVAALSKKVDGMQATLDTMSAQVATTAKANGWSEEE